MKEKPADDWANFNSHTREGVTGKGCLACRYPYFNSHTREGVTIIFGEMFTDGIFQLTHP